MHQEALLLNHFINLQLHYFYFFINFFISLSKSNKLYLVVTKTKAAPGVGAGKPDVDEISLPKWNESQKQVDIGKSYVEMGSMISIK